MSNAPEGLTSTLRLVANYWDNLAYAARFGSSKRTAAVQAFARKHVLSSKTVRFVGGTNGNGSTLHALASAEDKEQACNLASTLYAQITLRGQ